MTIKSTIEKDDDLSSPLILTESGIISSITLNGKQLSTCKINGEEKEFPASIKAGDLIDLPTGEVECNFAFST